MKIKIFKIFFLLAIFFVLPNFASASVIFETNFDSNPDWNVDGSKNGDGCSPIGAGSPYQCNVSMYPDGWDAFRSMSGDASFHPPVSIQRPPDNLDKTGAGKTAVIWQESAIHVNFPGDGMLLKKLSTKYPKLYLQFWFKSAPNWQFGPGEGYWKLFRVWQREVEDTNWEDYFNPLTYPVPNFILNPKHSDYGWRHYENLRGYPAYDTALYDRNDYTNYDSGGAVSFKSSSFYNVCVDPGSFNGRTTCMYGTEAVEQAWDLNNPTLDWKTTGQILDGGWHKITIQLEMNTKSGNTWNNDGIYRLWVDNVQHVNAVALRWIDNDGDSGGGTIGWNGFAIGGNSNNSYSGETLAEQWYAIDDVVVSTSQIPDNYVIGSDLNDVIAPSAPSGLNVL